MKVRKQNGRTYLEVMKPVIGIGVRGGKITGYRPDGSPEYGGKILIDITGSNFYDIVAQLDSIRETLADSAPHTAVQENRINSWFATSVQQLQRLMPEAPKKRVFLPDVSIEDSYYEPKFAETIDDALDQLVQEHIEIFRKEYASYLDAVPDASWDRSPLVITVTDPETGEERSRTLYRSDIWGIPEDGLPDAILHLWKPDKSVAVPLSKQFFLYDDLRGGVAAIAADDEVYIGTLRDDDVLPDSPDRLFVSEDETFALLIREDEILRGAVTGHFVTFEDGQVGTLGGALLGKGKLVGNNSWFVSEDGKFYDKNGHETTLYVSWPRRTDDPDSDLQQFLEELGEQSKPKTVFLDDERMRVQVPANTMDDMEFHNEVFVDSKYWYRQISRWDL